MAKKHATVKSVKTMKHIIFNNEYCPLPINLIPEHFGVELSRVNTVEWEKQIDGQIISFKINFIPKNDDVD